MLTRKKLEIAGAIIILAALLLLLLWLLNKSRTESPEVLVDEQPIVQELPAINPADLPTQAAVSASTVARIFVERFGSYSSESNFANVDDVMSLASTGYQSTLKSLVAQYRQDLAANSGYTGVSTRVINAVLVSEAESAATFLIKTQREEAVGTPGNATLRYQDVEVDLIKVGEDWLINDLNWK